MAHFAELDSNNTVVRVIVVNNAELLEDGVESEEKGIVFCQSMFGPDSRWVQTSYSGKFRDHYAGVGYIYDPDQDVFVASAPPEVNEAWVEAPQQ